MTDVSGIAKVLALVKTLSDLVHSRAADERATYKQVAEEIDALCDLVDAIVATTREDSPVEDDLAANEVAQLCDAVSRRCVAVAGSNAIGRLDPKDTELVVRSMHRIVLLPRQAATDAAAASHRSRRNRATVAGLQVAAATFRSLAAEFRLR